MRPMNTKAILGISLAASFAVSMIFAQNAMANGGDHKDVTGFDVEPFKNTIHVTISTSTDTIPDSKTIGYAFGYGFVTGTNDDGYPENVLALTTHLCVADSGVPLRDDDCPDPTPGLLEALGFGDGANEAHNDETWHAHILDLKPSTQDCIDAVDAAGNPVHDSTTYEVDLGRTLATQNNLSPGWTVTIDGGDISVWNVPRGDPHSAAYKKAGALYFGIVGIVEGDTVTSLCLTAPP